MAVVVVFDEVGLVGALVGLANPLFLICCVFVCVGGNGIMRNGFFKNVAFGMDNGAYG